MTHKTRTVHSAKTNFSKNGIEIRIVSLGETHLKISSAKYPTFCIRENRFDRYRVGGLVQDCSNSNALAMALMQSCAKPSICDGRLWLGCVISSLAANDSIGSTIFLFIAYMNLGTHLYFRFLTSFLNYLLQQNVVFVILPHYSRSQGKWFLVVNDKKYFHKNNNPRHDKALQKICPNQRIICATLE